MLKKQIFIQVRNDRFLCFNRISFISDLFACVCMWTVKTFCFLAPTVCDVNNDVDAIYSFFNFWSMQRRLATYLEVDGSDLWTIQ